MTVKYVSLTEVLNRDASAIRKLLAVEGRANLAHLTQNCAACDLVPTAESGHRAEVR